MIYNASFVAHRPILSDKDKQELHALSKNYSLRQFQADVRNYEEMTVDFVYTSAKIEGNTYDRVDTDNLLRMGVTAGGKRYSDAVMLVNLGNGFGSVMGIEPDGFSDTSSDVSRRTNIDLDYLCDLHKVLIRDLLPIQEQGIGRTSAVFIGANHYTPPSDASRLRTEVKFILQEADKYRDAFEQAIYLHCNLAYLQYFRDGNKRCSRMIQTAALVRGGVLPLFFNDTLIDTYKRTTVNYYETGEYGPYVAFFKENYQLAVDRLACREQNLMKALTIKERQERDRRIDNLPELMMVVEGNSNGEVACIFWALANNAVKDAGTHGAVNWPDIERQTIVKSIGEHSCSPEEVGAILCKFSPGATSPEKQENLLDDINRLAGPLQLQAQYEQATASESCESSRSRAGGQRPAG